MALGMLLQCLRQDGCLPDAKLHRDQANTLLVERLQIKLNAMPGVCLFFRVCNEDLMILLLHTREVVPRDPSCCKAYWAGVHSFPRLLLAI